MQFAGLGAAHYAGMPFWAARPRQPQGVAVRYAERIILGFEQNSCQVVKYVVFEMINP